MKLLMALLLLSALGSSSEANQNQSQDDKILERGDALLEEAKAAYETAQSKSSVSAFVDAGFKLEEARIKFIVLQEIGSPDKQKVATDRLRAINQLSKLIHDGKVAISGGAAEVAPVKPSDPPTPRPEPDPVAKVPPKEAKSKADVTARTPIPEANMQRDAEKAVKDLFKDQYSRKGPADYPILARALLDQAAKAADEPAALWVLLREAQEAALQTCDVKTATFAIEAMARRFDVDGLPMKSAAFQTAGKNAKTPPEFVLVAEALLGLVLEFVGIDQYDGADKASASALQYAKKANDTALVARATTSTKEVAEAKAKFQAMKASLQSLAKNPEDPVANSQMGQFLCFVKGNWDLGLRFTVKGSDAALKSLAEKEQAMPIQSADRTAIADGWYDLADKEKSPLCRRQMFAHSKGIYESALGDAPSLLRARIEKRLDAIQAAGLPVGPPVVDVTTLTPKRSAVGYFTLGINTNVKGVRVMVRGQECKQYLFAHAPSSIVYEVPPKTKLFTAVGTKLDKTNNTVTATWKYIVLADGKNIYESKPLNEVKGFDLDISVPLPDGTKEIELKVDEMGDYLADWAVWAYPKFLK